MPSISDYKKTNSEKKKTFKKKTYRPWDTDTSNENKLEEKKIETKEEKYLEEIEKIQNVKVQKKFITNYSSTLTGHQKTIFEFIYNKCKDNNFEDTGLFSLKEFSEINNIKYATSKTLIQRLINKGLIIRKISIRGKEGFNMFYIPEEVIKEVQNLKEN